MVFTTILTTMVLIVLSFGFSNCSFELCWDPKGVIPLLIVFLLLEIDLTLALLFIRQIIILIEVFKEAIIIYLISWWLISKEEQVFELIKVAQVLMFMFALEWGKNLIPRVFPFQSVDFDVFIINHCLRYFKECIKNS